MQFDALDIDQAFLVRIEPIPDSRGFFARTFCAREFGIAGLPTEFVQASVSYNSKRGTIRGMHFQWPPSREGKLVRCLKGRMLDVLLDLRPRSITYLRHVAVELHEESRDAVFVPHGVAHGFQTLADSTEVHYQMTDVFAPELGGGVRWSDPAFAIRWPVTDGIVISERDANYPEFDRGVFESELNRRRGPDE